MVEDFGRRRSQRFGQLAATGFRGKPGFEAARIGIPVVQPGVVAGDQIGQHAARGAETLAGQQRPGGGMGNPPGAALDVRALGFNPGRGAQIALKARPVLAEVVPQAGKMRPLLPTEPGRVVGGTTGDFSQVAGERVPTHTRWRA